LQIKNNEFIDDMGLEKILMTQLNLELLDISECKKINGHCLEVILSRNLKEIRVAFDDDKLECLYNVISSQMRANKVKIVNKTIKKF
jgi:hypothetical protein